MDMDMDDGGQNTRGVAAVQELQDGDEERLEEADREQLLTRRTGPSVEERRQRRIKELPPTWTGSLEAYEQWMRTVELRRQVRKEKRRQRRIMERRQEPYTLPPSRTGSLQEVMEERPRRRIMFHENRRQLRIMEERLPARSTGLVEANEKVSRMMMGHVPGMALGKKIVPPPASSHTAEPDFGEAIHAMRDLSLLDEP